jgi:hypothetical protein
MLIRPLIALMIFLYVGVCGANETAGSNEVVFKILNTVAISADVVELEITRDFPVAQEIRRHYQTKSYKSEHMVFQVQCSSKRMNVLAYQWYSNAGLSGTLVYASDRETGWFVAKKEPAAGELMAKVCTD